MLHLLYESMRDMNRIGDSQPHGQGPDQNGEPSSSHISHRFIEEMEHHHSLEKAVNNTVKNTGSALFGAAMTTVLGFGVLFFAILPPMKQFGTMTALTIFYSFLSSVWVLPSLLVLWARYTGLGKGSDEQTEPSSEGDEESGPEEDQDEES